MRMKKTLLPCMLRALAFLLCACSQQPPEGLKKETPQEAPPIYAEPDDSAALQFTATLYFAYGDTGLLRQESRVISRPPNETREKAMVRALLEGSREAGSRALFPEKTEVLSTHAQDGILYITFPLLAARHFKSYHLPLKKPELYNGEEYREIVLLIFCGNLTDVQKYF